jgi:hypothetical protein
MKSLAKFAGAGVLLAAIGAGPALAKDPLLSRMQGNWIGQGTVQNSPSAKPERIYCKISNKLVSGGSALEQKGRCAIASNSGRIKGKITAQGQGRYVGSLDSPQTKGPAQLSGQAKNDQIVMAAKFVDRLSKRPGTSTISLSIGDGTAYRLVSDTSNILFKPDKKK